jgi:hypothetical protein
MCVSDTAGGNRGWIAGGGGNTASSAVVLEERHRANRREIRKCAINQHGALITGYPTESEGEGRLAQQAMD